MKARNGFCWRLLGALSLALGLVGLPPSGVLAQTPGTASLSGTVSLEQDGSPLPGITVTALDQERGVPFSAETDGAGQYRISLLRPGSYAVSIEAPGFGAYRRTGYVLVVGQEGVVDIRLRPAAEAAVEVSADTTLIDPTSSQVSSNVTPQQIRALPLPTRNYLELALLAPGTSPGRDPAFTGVVGGGAQEARWTYISLDGADNNNFIVGGQQANVSQDSVQEFQVLTYNFSAEYGRSNAIVLNVITKSGTNDFHGSAYYFLRDGDWAEDAFVTLRDAAGFEVPQGSPDRDNWGATLGGPIRKDKAWFFASYDGLDAAAPITVQIAQRPDLSERVALTTDRTLAFGKVDVAASPENRLTLSYRYDDRDTQNLGVGFVGGRFTAASYGYAQSTKTQGAILTHQWVPSSRFYNEARLTLLDFDQASTPNSTLPGQQYPSYSLGGNPRFPQGGKEQRWGIADTVAFTMGRQFLRVGVDYSRWEGDVFFELFRSGLYTFRANVQGTPAFVFIGGSGDPTTKNEIDFYGVFVQDEWKVTDRLTLNLGLRWDFQDGAANSDSTSPFGIDNARSEDDDNFQPRLGFAWDLSGTGRTVLRGGGGIFHFQLFNNLSLNEDIFNGERFRIAIFPCFAAPAACTNLSASPTANVPQPSEIRANDADIQNPYTVTYSLGLATELGGGWGASADAVYSRGYHELGEIRENLPSSLTNPSAPRPDPRFATIRRVHSGADSEYYALLTSLRKAFSDKWLGQLSYTWSKCTNESEFFAVAVSDSRLASPFDNDRGPCRQDQRHRLVANSSYQLPWGFGIGGIVTWASGQPYSAATGVDINNDGAPPFGQDRPPGFSRNSELSDPYFRLDLRLSKHFDFGPVGLELIGEAFNVTNYENFDPSTYSNVIPPPTFTVPATFGRPGPSTSDLYQPRQFQVAARVSF